MLAAKLGPRLHGAAPLDGTQSARRTGSALRHRCSARIDAGSRDASPPPLNGRLGRWTDVAATLPEPSGRIEEAEGEEEGEGAQPGAQSAVRPR